MVVVVLREVVRLPPGAQQPGRARRLQQAGPGPAAPGGPAALAGTEPLPQGQAVGMVFRLLTRTLDSHIYWNTVITAGTPLPQIKFLKWRPALATPLGMSAFGF